MTPAVDEFTEPFDTADTADTADDFCDDPEYLSLAPQNRTRVMYQEMARRRIVTGSNLFVRGSGFDRASSLGHVVDTFQTWFHFPDPAVIFAGLGTIAAHIIPGSPTWLMLVGQQSSGKTEIIMSTTRLRPDVDEDGKALESSAPWMANGILVSSVSQAALISGTPKRDASRDATGGIMRQIGDSGVMLMKDFTSVLQMDRDERGKALGALREIYDGDWTRPMGSDGGRSERWRGKCSTLGACTFVIDTFQSMMAAMGERFLYFRLPLVNGYAQARMAVANAPYTALIQESTQSAVRDLFSATKFPKELPQLEGDDLNRITAMANLIAESRAPVERESSGNRRIIDVKPPEAPARAAKALNQLFHGMLAIGVHRDEAWRVAGKVAMDSMPATRLMILQAIGQQTIGENPSTEELIRHLRFPETPVRRTLEDLEAIHFLEREKDGKNLRYRLTEQSLDEYRRAFPAFKEE